MFGLLLLIKGMLLGFSIAAPVGPIGILCIRRTMQYGKISGLMTGLGAAFADVLYGAVAAFGLTAISDLLVGNEFWLRLVGGIFLIYLGVKIYRKTPSSTPIHRDHKNLAGDFMSTFLLTMTNPLTILSFLAVFAGLGLGDIVTTYSSATVLIAGIFIGSAAWWLLLSSGVSLFRSKIDQKMFKWVNRIAALLIMIFGLMALPFFKLF